jgi:hypothetical protein
MANLDPRIEAIRTKYGLAKEDFWELPQKKGAWLAKHAALEAVAVQAKIEFWQPSVIEANSESKCVAIIVTGKLGDREEWSIGEASPSNNKNSYPFAMAEKRGKDRVILKLVGLHGFVYSEEEADDFKVPVKTRNLMDPSQSISEWALDYCARQKTILMNCTTVAEVQEWTESQTDDLKELKKHALALWSDLRKFKENRIGNINLEGIAAE